MKSVTETLPNYYCGPIHEYETHTLKQRYDVQTRTLPPYYTILNPVNHYTTGPHTTDTSLRRSHTFKLVWVTHPVPHHTHSSRIPTAHQPHTNYIPSDERTLTIRAIAHHSHRGTHRYLQNNCTSYHDGRKLHQPHTWSVEERYVRKNMGERYRDIYRMRVEDGNIILEKFLKILELEGFFHKYGVVWNAFTVPNLLQELQRPNSRRP